MSRDVLKSAAIYASSNAANQAIAFVSTILLMKHLQLDSFGVFGSFTESIAILTLFGESGFRNFFIQRIRQKDRTESFLYFQGLCSAGSLLIGLIVVAILFKVSLLLLVAAIFMCWVQFLSVPAQAKFIAENIRTPLVMKDTITSILRLCIAYGFYRSTSSHVSLLIFLWVLPLPIGGLALMLMHRLRYGRIRNHINRQEIRAYTRKLMPFIGISLVNGLYNRTGIVAVQAVLASSAVAIYIGGIKLTSPSMFVQSALIMALIPKFAKNKDFSFTKNYFFLFVSASLLIFAFICFGFPILLDILNLHKYDPSLKIARIIGLSIIIIFNYGGISNYLSIHGQQKKIFYVNVASLVLYGFLSYFGSMKFGAPGAATAFVFCECLIGLFYVYYARLVQIRVSRLFYVPNIAILGSLPLVLLT